MKWIIVMSLITSFSLFGCQSDPQRETLSSATMDDGSSPPGSELEVWSDVLVESEVLTEGSLTGVEVETAAPASAAETGDVGTLTDGGKANANVLFVKAELRGDASWTFRVTVEHPDNGWEDYADGWDVVLPDGMVVKVDPESAFTRLLLHPHEMEQPFTRSQSGVIIPPGIEQVTVRAHDLVDGFGGKEVVVDLTVESGPDFVVSR